VPSCHHPPVRLAAVIAALTILGGAAAAQAPPPARDTMVAGRGEPIATLSSWAHDVWLALLDRDGSCFGRLAEEETFQRFNPLMDDEYELDVWTGLCTGAEDARWAPVRTGLRAAGARISHPLLLNVAEGRQDVGIAGPVVFVPRFVRQHSLSTRRDNFAVADRVPVLSDPLTGPTARASVRSRSRTHPVRGKGRAHLSTPRSQLRSSFSPSCGRGRY
jgi:hypothetical protein